MFLSGSGETEKKRPGLSGPVRGKERQTMAYTIGSLSDLATAPFDELIDVRSPAEFAEDHLPGAVNLPVLTNEERAQVGTIYVQDCKFHARKIGAALVAANASKHLKEHLAAKGGDYRPLVYCWRGGQRSGSFASILAQIGWRVETLKGGYRSYRRQVVDAVYHAPFPCPVLLLDGATGTAKTVLLAHLASAGEQVLDLEALANHRGSLFGEQPGGQPSQKAFEGALAWRLAGLNPTKPVLIEAESSRIGERSLPPSLWKAMQRAPRIMLTAPIKARAAFLQNHYADFLDTERLETIIERLRPMHAGERISAWLDLAREGNFEALAIALMEEHYDKRYDKHRRHHFEAALEVVSLPNLSTDALQAAASRIAQTCRTVAQP